MNYIGTGHDDGGGGALMMCTSAIASCCNWPIQMIRNCTFVSLFHDLDYLDVLHYYYLQHLLYHSFVSISDVELMLV